MEGIEDEKENETEQECTIDTMALASWSNYDHKAPAEHVTSLESQLKEVWLIKKGEW